MQIAPDHTLADVLSELRSMTNFMKTRQPRHKQRFPFACKNGLSCPYLACGCCWFKHDNDNSNSSDVIQQVPSPYAVLEKRVAHIQSAVENKFGEFSQHVEKRLGFFESKLEALAEATCKIEDDILQLEEQARPEASARKSINDGVMAELDNKVDDLKSELESIWGAKLESALDGIRSLIAAVAEDFCTEVGKKIVNLEERLEGVAPEKQDNG
jgi:hypothetical protein